MGPNSTNTDLSLSGPGTISCGHADNEAVFDVDSDGKGEVVLRAANGTIFGDGKVLAASTTQTDSFIVAIDGITGAEKGKEVLVPQDLIATGNVTGHFSSPYWDGVHPSLYFKGKAGGTKAMMDMGFDFKDGAWSLRFKAVRNPISAYPNFHQVRCLDLNQDGKDECINGGYAIDGTGAVLWNQSSMGGVVHGDRWHVGDLDPARPGLEGFSVSQNATSYDWFTEEVLAEQSGGAAMRIYSTAIPTDKRIYTLMHDPEYRNSMNEKGYIQSHMLDYYLGDGMTDPPKPNMTYPNTPGGGGSQ
jgi:hypothetical protein